MTQLAFLENRKTGTTLSPATKLDSTTKLYVFDREMMLLGKFSGVAIEEVDDASAVHYFLQWLHEKRAEVTKRNNTKRSLRQNVHPHATTHAVNRSDRRAST